MEKFIKENIAIVAAIILPLILAAVFMISSGISSATIPDPKHDFFITSNYYNPEYSTFRIDVVNDRIVVAYQPERKNEQGYTPARSIPKLWRVRVPAMSIEEIALIEPADKKATSINIPGVTDIPVRNVQPAPDGYEFMNSYYYGGNVMTEIFADSSRRNSGVAIRNKGRVIPVKVPSNEQWSYSAEFVGWVIDPANAGAP